LSKFACHNHLQAEITCSPQNATDAASRKLEVFAGLLKAPPPFFCCSFDFRGRMIPLMVVGLMVCGLGLCREDGVVEEEFSFRPAPNGYMIDGYFEPQGEDELVGREFW
jgi:hypothetical protein